MPFLVFANSGIVGLGFIIGDEDNNIKPSGGIPSKASNPIQAECMDIFGRLFGVQKEYLIWHGSQILLTSYKLSQQNHIILHWHPNSNVIHWAPIKRENNINAHDLAYQAINSYVTTYYEVDNTPHLIHTTL